MASRQPKRLSVSQTQTVRMAGKLGSNRSQGQAPKPKPKVKNENSNAEVSPQQLDGKIELKYFVKYFNLQRQSFSGVIQDDQNLRNLLKIVYKIFQSDLSVQETLLHILQTNGQFDLTSLENAAPGSVLDYHRQMDPNFVEILPDIFDEIIERSGDSGEELMRLLGYFSCLANQALDFDLCFYVFYGRELIQKAAGPTVATPGVRQKPDQNQNDCDHLKLMLTILEKYSLIARVSQTEAHAIFEDSQNSKFEIENIKIKVNPIVYNYLRQRGQSQGNESQNWSLWLVKLAGLLMNDRRVQNESHMISLHVGLKNFEFQKNSYIYSLHFATALTTWYNSHEEAREILMDVYNYFEINFSFENEDENFNICRMALLHLDNLKRQGDEVAQGAGDEWRAPEIEMMENFEFFNEADFLHTISRLEFFDWTMGQALDHKDNELIQHFAAQLIVGPVAVHEFILDDNRQKKMKKWIQQFCPIYANGIRNKSRIFNLLETPLTLMKIAMQFYPSIKVLQMAFDMAKGSNLDLKGMDQRAWFLQETLYLTKPSPICVWEEKDLSQAKLFEMRELCLAYVQQGKGYFIAMLTELEKIIDCDVYLDLHFLDFLETMKAAAYFDECVIILLKSTELLSNLKKIFHKIVALIETSEDDGNIKAAGHILVFWYALTCSADKLAQMKNSAVTGIHKEIENFYKKLSQPDSQVAQAFHAEKHWHSYFREQGETSEKILTKYLATPRNDQALQELENIYELAERLKDTTKKDWWSEGGPSQNFKHKNRLHIQADSLDVNEDCDDEPEDDEEEEEAEYSDEE